jgi:hypothetical protein
VKTAPQFLHIVIILLIFTSFGFCSASSFYITRDGAGSNNGSSLANAAACDATPGAAQSSCAAFNNSANWGSGSNQIGPGTTVYVGGDGVAIAATAGASSYFKFQSGGSPGNAIVFYLQTALVAPYWCCSLNGGAINIGGNSYVTIDGGGTPCGWNTATNASEGTCVGSIQATANGDSLSYQNETTGIWMSSCNAVEIRNLGIYNLYVKTNQSMAPVSDSISIFCDGSGNGFSVHDNDLHDNYQQLTWAPTSGTNSARWYNNNVYNMNQGYIEYANSAATISSFIVYGNHIHDMGLWDVNSVSYHHDGMYFTYPNGPQTITMLQVYNNVYDGTAQQSGNCGATSWFFMDGNDTVTNGYLWNNIVLETTQPSNNCPGDPMFNLGVNAGTINLWNNTFVCSSAGGNPGGFEIDQHSGSTTANVYNNLVVNCGRFTNLAASPGGANPPNTGYDHNVYANSNGNNGWDYHSDIVSSFSAWKSALGQDANAIFINGSASLGGSYENGSQSPISGVIPQSGSSAIGAGVNLTNLGCATYPGLCTDITGASRPASGTWDAGAVQSGSAAAAVNPPTGLSAVVQ